MTGNSSAARRSSSGMLPLVLAVVTLLAAHVQAASCAAGTFQATAPPTSSCATYSSSLPDGSLAFCNGIVDYPYYNPGLSQTALDQMAETKLLSGNPANGLLLSILPDRCTTQLKRIVCLAVFQACELVDPFYVDKACSGAPCQTCGDVTTVPFQVFNASHTPSYGSTCASTGNVASRCIVGPGKVPGMGHFGWELVNQLQGSGASMVQFCAAQGLHWSETARSCLVAVPRSPCKSECDKVWNMEKTVAAVNNFPVLVSAVCPLVSGNFTELLTFLSGSADPYVQTQATYALNNATGGRTTTSLLAAFQLAPNCNDAVPGNTDLFAFGETFTMEANPGRGTSLGMLIFAKASAISAFGEICHCTNTTVTLSQSGLSENLGFSYCDTDPAKSSGSCTTLKTQTAKCFKGGLSTPPNSGIRFVGRNDDDAGMLPICKNVVTHPQNQPNAQTLAFLQAAYGLTNEQAMGAFFVPPAPGLPALATGDMTQHALCAVPNGVGNGQVFRGNNSYQCAVASVKAAANVIPPILSGRCRLTFLDMLCNQAHMKLDFKTLCLLPNNAPCDPMLSTAAADNKIAFNFALPRFASQDMCLAFKSECGGFLSTLKPIQRAGIDATFNCTGTLAQSCAKNNPLDNWSSTWNCGSLLNGKPAYPAGPQLIASLTQLTTYAVTNGLTGLASVVVTSPVNATVSAATGGLEDVSTCECPAPLVVPDDPTDTLQPGVCCQQQCTGYMFSDGEFDQIILTQRVISVMSLFGTTFIVLTWGLFKIKRAQPLTFFIGLASLNVCFVFIIPTYHKADFRDVICKDNTQPNVQSDGGMCLFQSIWLTYWTLCTCCFWWTQSFDLYMRIVRGERHLEHLTKFYHMFAWGIPLIVVIVHLSLNAYGYRKMQFWCFLRDMPENPELSRGLDLGLFYGTIIAIWTTGLIFMFLVMWQIFKITSKTAGTAQSSNKIAKKLALYRTPVFFVFFFSYVWVSIFGWRFDLEVKTPLLAEAGVAWATCLLTNFAAGIPDPATNPAANTSMLEQYGVAPNTGCGLLLPLRLSYPSIIYLMFIAGLQGVFIFIIFGAKMENLNLWKEKLHLTTKKYDTTAEDSSTKENKSGAKPSILSQAMSSLFSPGSPGKAGDSRDDKEGGSAVMVNGLQSGKFIAVTDPPVKSNQVAAAYMAE